MGCKCKFNTGHPKNGDRRRSGAVLSQQEWKEEGGLFVAHQQQPLMNCGEGLDFIFIIISITHLFSCNVWLIQSELTPPITPFGEGVDFM